jgi:rhodanese-related sulfurtransferase
MEFRDITYQELTREMSKGPGAVTLLDANGTDSYRQGHIPGALDFSAEEGRLADVLPADKDALIVAYCGGPRCEAYRGAAEAAATLGYTNVRHFKPGISGWRATKARVESVSA